MDSAALGDPPSVSLSPDVVAPSDPGPLPDEVVDDIDALLDLAEQDFGSVMNVNVTASNLSATENGDTSTTDGDMNMIVDTMNTPSVSITISSSSLVMTDSTGTVTLVVTSL